MRLIEAIQNLRLAAALSGMPGPVIYLPVAYIVRLRAMIEEDLGGRLPRGDISSVMFDGVTFQGTYGRPVVRVKAGRRVIGESSRQVQQWRPDEVTWLARFEKPPMVLNRIGYKDRRRGSTDWMW